MFRSNRVGPHKARECLPLCLILRNRLKYALTYKEVTTILMQRCVKVDGKIRLDKCYPCGIMGTLFFIICRDLSATVRRGASGGVGCSDGSMAAENPRRKFRGSLSRGNMHRHRVRVGPATTTFIDE